MIELINVFFEKIQNDRHDLMVRKGFIENDVEYTDSLWNAFRNEWLSKPAI